MGIDAGQRAPHFELQDDQGNLVKLSAALEKGPVVLFFYPKDETPGCTKEACTFRDAFSGFTEAGASVFGISSDSSASHQRFRAKHSFPFPLLSDEGGKIRKLYGVPKTLGFLDGRSTYVIDRGGTVRHVFHSQLAVTRHAEEALVAVQGLRA
jgi:peroxiredoxin Q/BCP